MNLRGEATSRVSMKVRRAEYSIDSGAKLSSVDRRRSFEPSRKTRVLKNQVDRRRS